MKARLDRITNPQPEPQPIRNLPTRARSSVRTAADAARMNLVESKKAQSAVKQHYPKTRGLIPK